jgi:energy-converting hydrogenase Eha subunit H
MSFISLAIVTFLVCIIVAAVLYLTNNKFKAKINEFKLQAGNKINETKDAP